MTTLFSIPHALPPPLELRDADRVVGAIEGDVVRFRGFPCKSGAARAAAVARRAMLRRLARSDGVATFVVDDPGDFAFEVRVPPPVDELRMRAMAYVMYRALRSSGVPWPLVDVESGPKPATARVANTASAESHAPRVGWAA